MPETENELDNLTEFNTAQNRRISMMGIPKEETFIKKRRKIHITFNEEEDVINPWDVDPSIGRFTNLVQSTVIPKASKGPACLIFSHHSKRREHKQWPTKIT